MTLALRFGSRAAACLLIPLATAAAAQLAPRERPIPTKRTDAWIAQARIAEERIARGDFTGAEKEATNLLAEMLGSITVGRDAGNLLAVPLSLRAVARAGLDRARDALWDLQVATEVYPETALVSLAKYGEVGTSLARWREAEEASSPVARIPRKGEASEEEIARWQRPERLSGEQPRYPAAFREAMREARVVLEVTIGSDGSPTSPKVVDQKLGGPLMAVASLEALRTWSFALATRDESPIAVRYQVTFSYRLGSAP